MAMAMATEKETEKLVWRKEGDYYVANWEGVAMRIYRRGPGDWGISIGANLPTGFSLKYCYWVDSLGNAKLEAERIGMTWEARRAAADLVLSVSEW